MSGTASESVRWKKSMDFMYISGHSHDVMLISATTWSLCEIIM